MRIIYAIAKKYHRKYPDHDYWHLVGAGWIGYCDALRLYKSQKSSFKTFVDRKIRFAIREALWFDTPYKTKKDLCKRQKERWEKIEDYITFPAFDFEFDRKLKLRDAINTLPEKERIVIIETYFRGKITEDIGKMIGVNKSRVSQIKKAALHRLSKLMEKKGIT